MLGESQIVLCGGVDNMSMAPYAVRDIRFGTRLGKAPEVRYINMKNCFRGKIFGLGQGIRCKNLEILLHFAVIWEMQSYLHIYLEKGFC